jgi:hypothetical protein
VFTFSKKKYGMPALFQSFMNREFTCHAWRYFMYRKFLAALFLFSLFAGCTTVPEIRSDYDKSNDFSRYKTFAFIEPLATDQAGYSTLLTSQIKRAVQSQLESRGYVYNPNSPDLLINFNAKVEQKIVVTQTPIAPVETYYGYRGVLYSRWSNYGYETIVDQYDEGTLNVDIVDAARKQLVWEGVAIGRVTKKAIKEREARIDTAMRDIFAQYPFTARQ